MKSVSDLMRTEFVHISPEDSLLDADRIMRLARIRHLPVVEREALVGVLSNRDVLETALSRIESAADPAASQDHLRRIRVGEIMSAHPVTTGPETSLQEAARLLLRHKIGCLPVVSEREGRSVVIGLITESDLIRAAYAPEFEALSD
ncbi:MAG: CBS domain-containing protein [Myxococcota bacterium]